MTSATADRSYNVINLRQDNSVQSRLFLSTVSEFDYGNYTCTAANELGSVSKAIVLSRKLHTASQCRDVAVLCSPLTPQGNGSRTLFEKLAVPATTRQRKS